MTLDLNSSQTNTDAGLSIATDYQAAQRGDLLSNPVMAEIVRRLELAIFEAGFQQAITAAIEAIILPDPGIGISEETNQLLRSDASGDVLLQPIDIPFPQNEIKNGVIGDPIVSPVTVTWDTAFPNAKYHLSVCPANDISATGRFWVNKFADHIDIHFLGIGTGVTMFCYAHSVTNVNP